MKALVLAAVFAAGPVGAETYSECLGMIQDVLRDEAEVRLDLSQQVLALTPPDGEAALEAWRSASATRDTVSAALKAHADKLAAACDKLR